VPEFLRTILAFAVVLGVLVFVHELGHYLAARWRGIHVEAFSIGFGRSIARWTDRRGTVWKLGWIPLGGYVKLHGQERPEDVSPEMRAAWQPGRTFHSKSVGDRAIVVAAGPVANFVLAAVLFSALFVVVGRPIGEPVIATVIPGGAAAAAGLQPDDRIVAIDGVSIARFSQLQKRIAAAPDRALTLRIRRAGQEQNVPVHVGTDPTAAHPTGLLGIRGGKVAYTPVSMLDAIPAGIAETGQTVGKILSGIGQMISGTRGAGEIGGPLAIAQMSGQVAQLGVAALIRLIALLSVNLGLLNLFPIPVLDGGHLLFFAAEALRGRPLAARAQEYGFRAGLALLAGLFVFATWNDLSHIGVVQWVAHRFG